MTDCWLLILFTRKIRMTRKMIKDYWWLMTDCWLSSHGKHGWNGGPQADFVGERVSSEFKRNLNGCPQADGGGERQLENNKYPQMSQMDTDGGPQADDGGEQQLSKIGQQLKGNYWLFTHYIFQRCSSSYASVWWLINDDWLMMTDWWLMIKDNDWWLRIMIDD